MNCQQDSEGIQVRGTFIEIMHILSANIRDVYVEAYSVFELKISSIFPFVDTLETLVL